MNNWQVLSVKVLGPEPTPLPDFGIPTLLVFPAGADGEALAGATAALCRATVLGRITDLSRRDGNLVATRSSHGGRIAITLRPAAEIAVATANVLPECDGNIELGAPTLLAVDRTALTDQRISLESAPIVIGGGRGLDDAGFRLLERLAELVGGAVGASLPAIDLGLASVSRQVGQSGKFVTPRIYLAVGLSGTPQHLAGIGDATRLMAINSDPDAAIFKFAEAGIIADARQLLPILVETIEQRMGKHS